MITAMKWVFVFVSVVLLFLGIVTYDSTRALILLCTSLIITGIPIILLELENIKNKIK